MKIINLIENTDYNITEIANAVGYDNSMYFSRVFKKHTGMTPTEYKRRNEKKINKQNFLTFLNVGKI